MQSGNVANSLTASYYALLYRQWVYNGTAVMISCVSVLLGRKFNLGVLSTLFHSVLEQDAKFLAKLRIMDYSLLVRYIVIIVHCTDV